MGRDGRAVMFGRYRVEGLLGRGGMGEVHRAYDTEHDRVVALKRLSVTADGAASARFRRESRIAASLDAPHVTTIYDYGEIDGRLYLAMRLVEGTDLRRVLDEGALAPDRALGILVPIATVLDTAHAAGVVHRDVKPSNILLDESGTAYLADFGIAKSLAPDATSVTHTGGEIGTLDYMAPERLMHNGSDHRADVYALACVLFECLTGKKPFPAEDAAGKLAAQLNDPPPAPSLFDWRIPRAVDLVVATGMDKDPQRRYPTAGELMAAAEAAFRQEPVTTPDPVDQPGPGHIMDAIVAVAGRRRVPKRNPADPPYPGLRSFSAAETGLFHGREQAITDVLVRLSRQSPTTGPLVVVGASGTGKSSLIRAGVLPALSAAGDGESWPQVVTTPGPNPIGTLAARLAPLAGADADGMARWMRARPAEFGTLCARIGGGRREQGRLVLVVDQFEEVFTTGEPGQRQAFVTLLASAWPALVVLAVRADFLDQCLRLAPLRAAMAGPYPLGPLGIGDLERVIVEPARAAGLQVEDGLVDRLITDVGAGGTGGYDPGALPRLAHALRETWHNRTGSVLTLKGYQDTGGVDRAVARTADGVYTRLSTPDQELLRTALLRMVTVLDGGGVTRRRAARAEIPEHVLTHLVDARLVTAEAGGVQLSHDALLTAWPRLREWVDQDRQGLLVRQHLGQAVGAWETGGRDPGELYRGARLAATLEWAEQRTDLTHPEHAFLHASRRAQQRNTRRLRTLVAGLAAFLALAVVAGTVAAVKWGDATRAASEAESRQIAAGSLADAGFDPLGARSNALQAWQRGQTRQAMGALLSSATYDYPIGFDSRVQKAHSVDISADGGLIATGGANGRVRVIDARTGEKIDADLDGHSSAVDVEFSPDGTMLAAAGRGAKDDVSIWEMPGGRPLATLPARGFAAWRPDGGALAALGFPDGPDQPARAVGVWQPRTGANLGWLTTPYQGDKKFPIRDGEYSPDGGRLALGRTNGVVELWDPAKAALVHRDTGHRDNASAGNQAERATARVAFSAGLLASASAADSTIRFADPVSGAAQERTIAVDPTFGDLAFTGDGGHLLTIHNAQGGVGRWNVPLGEIDSFLPGPPDGEEIGGLATSLAVSASGDTVAVKADGRLVLWRRNPYRSFAPTGGTRGVAFTPDGTRISAAADGLYTWHPEAGEVRRDLAGSSPFAVDYLPDGTRIVAGRDGTVTVTGAGGSVRTADVGSSTVADAELAVAPDGASFAVRAREVATDGTDVTTVSVWDAGTLDLRSRLDLGSDTVSGPVFSPDGETLLVAATATPREDRPDETVTEIRRWRTGDFTESDPIGIDAPGIVRISPDGATLFVVRRNQVQVRDAETGDLRREFGKHPAAVDALAVSPDGRLLATGMVGDPAIRVWDLTTRTHIATLTGHEGGTSGLEFSPDSSTLASTGADADIRRWPLDPARATRQICRDLAAAGKGDLTELGCPT